MNYLEVFCRVVVGGTFLFAVGGKLRDRQRFAATIADFRMVPRGAEAGVATAVIAAEALVVTLLAIPVTVPRGFLLAALLLAGFAVAAVITLGRGITVPCNCFGRSSVPLSRVQVGRNLLLAGVAVAGFAAAANDPGGRAPAAGPLVVVGLVGLALVALVRAADDIARLFSTSQSPYTSSEVRHGHLERGARSAGSRRLGAVAADRRDHQKAERAH